MVSPLTLTAQKRKQKKRTICVWQGGRKYCPGLLKKSFHNFSSAHLALQLPWPFNPNRTGLFEYIPKYYGVGWGIGFQFFLEMTCSRMIYHIKRFMMFRCLEPSKIMFDFWNLLMVGRRLTQFVRVPPYEILVFLTNFIFFAETRLKVYGPFPNS